VTQLDVQVKIHFIRARHRVSTPTFPVPKANEE
jgi:hypothetical protein